MKHISLLKTFLQTFIKNCPHSFFKLLNCNVKYVWIKNQILNLTPQLSSDYYKISTRIYWILNDIKQFPLCKTCGKPIIKNVINVFKGYGEYCSAKCVSNDLNQVLKRKNTCIEKYGVDNPAKLASTKEKAKQTFIRHYGVDNNMKSAKGIAELKHAIKEKYGVESVMQLQEIKKKVKQTFIRHYGVDNNMKSNIGLQKYSEAIFQKYGVTWTWNNKSVQEKSKNTKIKKYGNIKYNNREKAKQTNLERFGFEYAIQNPEISRKAFLNKTHSYLYNSIHFDSKPELAMYIWLTDNSIDFEYQPKCNMNYVYNGKTRQYFPDFKIKNIFYEIKGDHMISENGQWICPWDFSQNARYEAKHQCAINNGVIILITKDYQIFLNYIDETYGKLYLDQFKNV